MPVEGYIDIIFFDNLIKSGKRRIVGRQNNLLGAFFNGVVYRHFHSQKLALVYFLVFPAKLFFKRCYPSSAPGDSYRSYHIGIVLQKINFVKPFLFLKLVHFFKRRPPVIVISFADDFSARQIVNECKILRSGIEPHSP